jgi:Fur family transcriptional regulator, zinc uptake regulator
MAQSTRHGAQLSAKDTLVMEALRAAARPLSAYDIIDLLHTEGISSPPTVYRALKRLTHAGLAHRIESLNAFVPCAQAAHVSAAAFAICSDCGTVIEFHQPDAIEKLAQWADQHTFQVNRMTIELRGQCDSCASAPTNPTARRGQA